MFNITFRKLNGERSLLDKSNAFIMGGDYPSFVVSGVLKEQSSIIDPVVLIRADTTIMEYNYAEIDTFKRKYFVTDIKNVRNDLWEVSLHVDVLYSYKDVLLQNDYFVERNQYDFNDELPDKANSFKPLMELDPNMLVYKNGIRTIPIFDRPTGGPGEYTCVVIIRDNHRVESSGQSYMGSDAVFHDILAPTNPLSCSNLTTYICDYYSARQIIEAIADNLTLMQQIHSIRLYPVLFNIEGVRTTHFTEITLNNGDSTITISNTSLYRLEDTGHLFKFATSILFTGNPSLYYDYENIYPNKQFEMWLPFYGKYSPDFNKILAFQRHDTGVGGLNITYTINVISATCSIYVSVYLDGDLFILDTLQCSIANSAMYIGSNEEEVNRRQISVALSTLGTIISSVGAVIAAVAMPASAPALTMGIIGTAGAIGAATSMAGQLQELKPTFMPAQSQLNSLDVLNYGCYSIIYTVFKRTYVVERDDTYKAIAGMPCYKCVNGSSIHGFSVITEVHLIGLTYATTGEEDEIMRLLKAGVHFPEPA